MFEGRAVQKKISAAALYRVPFEAACREQAFNKSKSGLRPAVEFHKSVRDTYFLLVIYMV